MSTTLFRLKRLLMLAVLAHSEVKRSQIYFIDFEGGITRVRAAPELSNIILYRFVF